MNDERNQPPEDEDLELGPPVLELAQLREEPSPPRLLGLVHSSIQRRTFASQLLTFGMPVFMQTILEYLSMAFSIFGSGDKKPGDKKK